MKVWGVAGGVYEHWVCPNQVMVDGTRSRIFPDILPVPIADIVPDNGIGTVHANSFIVVSIDCIIVYLTLHTRAVSSNPVGIVVDKVVVDLIVRSVGGEYGPASSYHPITIYRCPAVIDDDIVANNIVAFVTGSRFIHMKSKSRVVVNVEAFKKAIVYPYI